MKKNLFVFLILMIFMISLPASAKMKKLGHAGLGFLNIGGSARASAWPIPLALQKTIWQASFIIRRALHQWTVLRFFSIRPVGLPT